MKVEDSGRMTGLFDIQAGADKRLYKSSAQDFLQTLKMYDQTAVRQHFEQLVQRIEKQGARLGQSININELRYYKQMVSEFLHQALHLAAVMEEDQVFDGRGRMRRYFLVKKVNQTLEELVEEVMNGEKDHLAVLRMIDDIRGMLIDLML